MKKFFAIILTIGTLTSFAQNLQTVKTYYDPYTKTHLNEVYTVIAGTPTKHGSYKSYDQAGNIAVEKTYVNGMLEGQRKEYYGLGQGRDEGDGSDLRGKIAIQEVYKRDVLVQYDEYGYINGKATAGIHNTYSPKGEPLMEERRYANGKLASSKNHQTGDYAEYYDNGQKKEAYKFGLDGYPVGGYTKWYDDGQVMETKKDSAGVILAMESHERGGKIYAVTLTPEGKYISTTLDTLGKKAEEAENKPSGRTPPFYYDGPYKAYWPTGEVRTIGQYKEGNRVGEWKYLAVDGKLLSDAEWPQGTAKLKDEIRRLIGEKAALLTNAEVDKVEALLKRGTDDGYQQALDILRAK